MSPTARCACASKLLSLETVNSPALIKPKMLGKKTPTASPYLGPLLEVAMLHEPDEGRPE